MYSVKSLVPSYFQLWFAEFSFDVVYYEALGLSLITSIQLKKILIKVKVGPR